MSSATNFDFRKASKYFFFSFFFFFFFFLSDKGGKHARRRWFAIYLQREEGKCKIRIFDRWPESQTSGREYADSKGSARPHDFTPPGGPPMEKLRSECSGLLFCSETFVLARNFRNISVDDVLSTVSRFPRALVSFLLLTILTIRSLFCIRSTLTFLLCNVKTVSHFHNFPPMLRTRSEPVQIVGYLGQSEFSF